MELKSHEEILGQLTNVEVLEDGQIKLRFSIHKEIELSANALSVPQLQSLIGSSIGIININDQFFLREI